MSLPAEYWPASAQEDLVNAALIIEQNQQVDFDFTAEDWKIIDERLAGTARGEFATDVEMEALFAKYRLPKSYHLELRPHCKCNGFYAFEKLSLPHLLRQSIVQRA